MAKKTFRRTVASILAVLAVTGNAIAPVGTGVLLAENAIVAEAANYTNGYCTYNSDTKTLTITGSLDNTDNGGGAWGIAEGTGLVLPRGVNKEDVQHVIIGKNASLPPQSGHMFEGFKNLETVEVQKGAKIRANATQGSANLAGMFKGCEKLKEVDLSNLAGGEAVRYVDHMFEGCTALESVNISNITGDKLDGNNFYSRDPIAEAVKNCENLTDVKMSTDFIDNAMKELGFATPEAVLDDFLKDCPNADLLKAKLLEQYNSEEYYTAEYTWAADFTSCTASRKNKKTNKITKETVNATVETTESSCTVAGKIVYTAVFTNSLFTTQTMQDDLPLKEHTPGDAEIENEVPASCTEEGSYDEVIYCTVCGEELSRTPHTTEMEDHQLTHFEANEPGCYDDGNIEYYVCDVCGKYFDADGNSIDESEIVISATPHTNIVKTEAKAPACEEDGNSEYWYCPDCGKYFADAEYKEEIEEGSWVLQATGHKEGEAVREHEVPATCDHEGSYDEVVYCTVCGEELSRDPKIIEKLAHTPGEAVKENEVEASCTADGSYDEVVYCAVCGEELSREPKTIPMHEHTKAEAVRENEVEASCIADGSYDEVVRCTECGAELSRETKTIEKLDHKFEFAGFVWSEDYTSAQAKFDCSNDGCEESALYDAEMTSETMLEPTAAAPGLMTYTAIYIYEDADGEVQTESDSVTVEIPPVQLVATIKSVTASFNDMIRLNFYIELPEDLDENAYVEITNGDSVEKINAADTVVDSKGRNKFSISMFATQVKDDVTLKLYDGDGNVVTLKNSKGTDFTDEGYTYSIETYLDAIIKQDTQKELAIAAKDYCYAASNYFLKTNYELSEAVGAVDSSAMDDYVMVKKGTQSDDIHEQFAQINKGTITGMFESDNSLRLYLQFDDAASADDFTYKIDGQTAELYHRNGDAESRLYLTATGIAAPLLHKTHTFEISKGDETFTYTFSAVTYARGLANMTNNTAANELGNALYLYSEAAKAAFPT